MTTAGRGQPEAQSRAAQQAAEWDTAALAAQFRFTGVHGLYGLLAGAFQYGAACGP